MVSKKIRCTWLIMWLCGWALILEGLCSIVSLGLWNPVVETRFYLWLKEVEWDIYQWFKHGGLL